MFFVLRKTQNHLKSFKVLSTYFFNITKLSITIIVPGIVNEYCIFDISNIISIDPKHVVGITKRKSRN